MFRDCESYNKSMAEWDVSGITDMNNMINGCYSFNQHELHLLRLCEI